MTHQQANNICYICGKPTEISKATTEHFFPRAIYKWNEEMLPRKDYLKLKRTINSKKNLIYNVHEHCNMSKSDTISSINTIAHISNEKKEKLRDIHGKIRPYLDNFARL